MANLKKFLMILLVCALFSGSAKAFIMPDLQPVDQGSKPELDLTGTPSEASILLGFTKELIILRQTLVSFTDVTRLKQLSQMYITKMGETALNFVTKNLTLKSKKAKIMSLSRTIEECKDLKITDDTGTKRVVDIRDANMVKKAFQNLFFQYPSPHDTTKNAYVQKGEQMKIDTSVEMYVMVRGMQKKLYGEEREIQKEWYCTGNQGGENQGKSKEELDEECKKKISKDGLLVLPDKENANDEKFKDFNDKLMEVPIDRLGIITQLRLYERCLSGNQFCEYIKLTSCEGDKDVAGERSASTGGDNEDMACFWNSAIKAETLYDTVMRYNHFLVAMWTRYRVVRGIGDVAKIKEYKDKKKATEEENVSSLPEKMISPQKNTVVAQKLSANAAFAEVDLSVLSDTERKFVENEKEKYDNMMEDPSNEMSGYFERADGAPGYENVMNKKEENFINLQAIASIEGDLQRAETLHNILKRLPNYLEIFKTHKYTRQLHDINRKVVMRSEQCINKMLGTHYLYPNNAWFGKKRDCQAAVEAGEPTGRVICRRVNIKPLEKEEYIIRDYTGATETPKAEKPSLRNETPEIWMVSCPDNKSAVCYSINVDDYMAILDEENDEDAASQAFYDELFSENKNEKDELAEFKKNRYDKPLEMREKGGIMQYLVDYYRAAIDGNAIYEYDETPMVNVESVTAAEEEKAREDVRQEIETKLKNYDEPDYDALNEKLMSAGEGGDYAHHVSIKVDEVTQVNEEKTPPAKYLQLDDLIKEKGCDPTIEDCEIQMKEENEGKSDVKDGSQIASRGPNDIMDKEVSKVDVVTRDDQYEGEDGEKLAKKAESQNSTGNSDLPETKDEDQSDDMTADAQEQNLLRWIIGSDVMNTISMDLARGIDPDKRGSSKIMVHIDGTIGKDTLNHGFPVWHDYKAFYDEYINTKFENMKDYIKTIPNRVLIYSIAISLGVDSLEVEGEEGSITKSPKELLEEYFDEENAKIEGAIAAQEAIYDGIKAEYIEHLEKLENGVLDDLEIEEIRKKNLSEDTKCNDNLELGTCSDIIVSIDMGRKRLVEEKNKISTRLSAFNNAYNKYSSDIKEAEAMAEYAEEGIEYNKELYTSAGRTDLEPGKYPQTRKNRANDTNKENKCYGREGKICDEDFEKADNYYGFMTQTGNLNEEIDMSEQKRKHAEEQMKCYLGKANVCEEKLEIAKSLLEEIEIRKDMERRVYTRKMSDAEADAMEQQNGLAATIHKYREEYDNDIESLLELLPIEIDAEILDKAREEALEEVDKVFLGIDKDGKSVIKNQPGEITNSIRDLQYLAIYSLYYYDHEPELNEHTGKWSTFLIDLDNLLRKRLINLSTLAGANMFAGVYETEENPSRGGEYTKRADRYFLGIVGVKDDFLAPYAPLDSTVNNGKGDDFSINLPVRESVYFDGIDFSNIGKHYIGDGESHIQNITDTYISRRQFLADLLGCSIYDNPKEAEDFMECAKANGMQTRLESVPDVWLYILAPRTFGQREFDLRTLIGQENGEGDYRKVAKGNKQSLVRANVLPCRSKEYDLDGNLTGRTYLDSKGNSTGVPVYHFIDVNEDLEFAVVHNDALVESDAGFMKDESNNRTVFSLPEARITHPDWQVYTTVDQPNSENHISHQQWIEGVPECKSLQVRVRLDEKGHITPDNFPNKSDRGIYIYDQETGAVFDNADLDWNASNGMDLSTPTPYNFAKNASELGHILEYYKEDSYDEEDDEVRCETKFIKCVHRYRKIRDEEDEEWTDDEIEDRCGGKSIFSWGGRADWSCATKPRNIRMRLSFNNVLIKAFNKYYENYGEYDKSIRDFLHVMLYLKYRRTYDSFGLDPLDVVKNNKGRQDTTLQNFALKIPLMNGQLSDFLNQIEVLRVSEENVRKSRKRIGDTQQELMQILSDFTDFEIDEDFDLAEQECTNEVVEDTEAGVTENIEKCEEYKNYDMLHQKLQEEKNASIELAIEKMKAMKFENVDKCTEIDELEQCLQCDKEENKDICLRVASLMRQILAYRMDDESSADAYPEELTYVGEKGKLAGKTIKYPGDLVAINGDETKEEMLAKMEEAFANYTSSQEIVAAQDEERENSLKMYKRPYCSVYPFPSTDFQRFLTK